MPPKRVSSRRPSRTSRLAGAELQPPCSWKRQPATPSRISRPRAGAPVAVLTRQVLQAQRCKETAKVWGWQWEASPLPQRERHLTAKQILLPQGMRFYFLIRPFFFFFSSFRFTTNLRRRDGVSRVPPRPRKVQITTTHVPPAAHWLLMNPEARRHQPESTV